MFLAPAFTSGAISLEREKQTLDMLAATPISSLAIVIGKLLSALAYVFLLIAASIPLTAIVFVFGGVGPDDVLRAYAVLIVSALGLGSLGLFISAADAADAGRDGRDVLHRPVPHPRARCSACCSGTRWPALEQPHRTRPGSGGLGPIKGRRARGLPLVQPVRRPVRRDLRRLRRLRRLVQPAATDDRTARSRIGSGDAAADLPDGDRQPGSGVDDAAVARDRRSSRDVRRQGRVDATASALGGTDPQPFGIRRDTFWPRSLRAWGVLSVVFILASIQLVSPTRRWRLPFRRPSRRTA